MSLKVGPSHRIFALFKYKKPSFYFLYYDPFITFKHNSQKEKKRAESELNLK